ncbi:MAG: acetyl-CoA C-acyltransferase [Candidatus Paracaedibacteraceae bacterium]|nr:acetyl-CoA C-acyltransferase [Candidatus Paracaedibacteraceae bacterium]
MLHPIFIISAKRTPNGAFQGQLSAYQGFQIGAEALRGAHIKSHFPETVIMGCVLGAGQGQAPARQATCLAFGVDSIPTITVNKVCGSGMQSIAFACQSLQTGQYSVVMAGGFESMTNAPYLLPKGRGGYRMGHGVILDHMMLDGLEDAYGISADGSRRSMGTFADATAEKYGFSRADQEKFAAETYENYKMAEADGAFSAERLEITYNDPKGNVTIIDKDEPPTRVKPTKFEMLRPAFSKTGTVTAATSSSIADGAAALTLCTESALNGTAPLAKIVGFSAHASAPEWFTTAPVGAIQKLLNKLNWSVSDVDLFEINEAFAVVPMLVMKDLKIDRSKMNVHGGSCTLGHPIGASGARIVVTLLHALRERGLKRGIAAACIGGGEATAIAIEIC